MGDSGLRSTCIASVHNELRHLESLSLGKPLAPDSDFAGVSNLRRPHQNLKGAVGDVLAALAYAHHMLTNLLGCKRDPCGEGTVSRASLRPPPPRYPQESLHSPMCLLGRRFSRHGSSLPEGARILAVSWLRSPSVIFSDTSVEVPTLSCDVLIESSPGRRQIRVGTDQAVGSRQALAPLVSIHLTTNIPVHRAFLSPGEAKSLLESLCI